MNSIGTTDFNEILKNLKDLSSSFVVDVYVPSIDNFLTFKELNARQQKLLLETLADDSLYKTRFNKQFYSILQENITTSFDINTLSVFDKIFTGLYLRSKISSKYNVVFSEDPSYTEEIDLYKIIDNLKNYKQPKNESITITKNSTNIFIELGIPSIQIDLKYEEELYSNYQKIENIKEASEVGSILSNAFIGEISKYITKIYFDNQDIDLNNLTVQQRIRLTEQLTGDVIQTILTKITVWKETLNNFLTVSSMDGKYSKVLSLDNLLFLS